MPLSHKIAALILMAFIYLAWAHLGAALNQLLSP
jgi:hypothetical protein